MTAYLHSKDGHKLTKVSENSQPLTSHIRWAMKNGIPVSDKVATQVQPVSCTIPASAYRIDDSNNTLHMRFTLAPWMHPKGTPEPVAFPVSIPPGTYPELGNENGKGTAYAEDDESLCAVLAKAIVAAYDRLAKSHGGGGLGPGGENPTAIEMLPGTDGQDVKNSFIGLNKISRDPSKTTPTPKSQAVNSFEEILDNHMTQNFGDGGFGMLPYNPFDVDDPPSGQVPTTQAFTYLKNSAARTGNIMTFFTAQIRYGTQFFHTYLEGKGSVGYYTVADLARLESGAAQAEDFHVIVSWAPLEQGNATQKFTIEVVQGTAPPVAHVEKVETKNQIYLVDEFFKSRIGKGNEGPLLYSYMYWEPLIASKQLPWKLHFWADENAQQQDVPLFPVVDRDTHPMFPIEVTTQEVETHGDAAGRGVALAFQQLVQFTAHAFPQENVEVTDPTHPFDQPFAESWFGGSQFNETQIIQASRENVGRFDCMHTGKLTQADADFFVDAANNYDVCPLYFTGSSQTERLFTWEGNGFPTQSMTRIDYTQTPHNSYDSTTAAWFECSKVATLASLGAQRYIFDWSCWGSVDGQANVWKPGQGGIPLPGVGDHPEYFPGPTYLSCAPSRVHCTNNDLSPAPLIREVGVAASAADCDLAYYVEYGKVPRGVPETMTKEGFSSTPVDVHKVSSSFMIPFFDVNNQRIRFNLFGKSRWRQFYGAKPLHYNTYIQYNRFAVINSRINLFDDDQKNAFFVLYGFRDGGFNNVGATPPFQSPLYTLTLIHI